MDAPPKLDTAIAAVATPREDWLALQAAEAILEPELPIVDPHHHLWERRGHRYLLPELLADTGSGHRIEATVFVDCMAFYRAEGPAEERALGEVEFANGVAAMAASGLYGPTRACAGIVSFADLARGAAVAGTLEAMVRAGNGRFRGIRHAGAWDASPAIHNAHTRPPPGLYALPAFREGFARLAPLGLSFEAWQFHPQLPEVIALARAFPETAIVLNHVGGVLGVGPYAGRADETFTRWRGQLAELARCENVVVKLGGLGMRIGVFDFHERATPPGSAVLAAAWRPWIEACIEAFGPRRCMFESNFPVDKLSTGYAVLWNAFKRLAAGASVDEKAALFSGTARRVYRL
jgi:predicted TIM-barrel fold metal-dependent hydrolase